MTWQDQLISIYLIICQFFEQHPEKVTLRSDKCAPLKFTDQEVITIYLFGITMHHGNKKEIHAYAEQLLPEWFPNLPNYEAFNYRVNQMEFITYKLCEFIISQFKQEFCYVENIVLVDSLPIIMATGHRAHQAKVAIGEADLGYCSSKDLYYHGVKLHLLAKYNDSTLPTPKETNLTKASIHDLTGVKKIIQKMKSVKIIGDKAYLSKQLKKDLKGNKVELHTPVKLSKSKRTLSGDEKIYSRVVSSFRQPIESFFNWLIEKTNIQKASKVRSRSGLLTHVFGRLAGGLLLLHFSF